MQTNLFSNIGTTVENATPTKAAASASSEMFTKLLVAQIQNQDPLSPTDPAQFVNQLTQLSQTEALQSLSSMTSSSASVLQSLQVLALGGQVGSTVAASATEIKLGGAKVEAQITLERASSNTALLLTGSDGKEHTLALGVLGAGSAAFSIDPSALGLAPGTYQLKVKTSSGETPGVDIVGKLNGVRLSAAGAVLLDVANLGEVAPTSVTGFKGNLAAASSPSNP